MSHSGDDGPILFAHGQWLFYTACRCKALIPLLGRYIDAFYEQADVYDAMIEDFLAQTLGC